MLPCIYNQQPCVLTQNINKILKEFVGEWDAYHARPVFHRGDVPKGYPLKIGTPVIVVTWWLWIKN